MTDLSKGCERLTSGPSRNTPSQSLLEVIQAEPVKRIASRCAIHDVGQGFASFICHRRIFAFFLIVMKKERGVP